LWVYAWLGRLAKSIALQSTELMIEGEAGSHGNDDQLAKKKAAPGAAFVCRNV